LTSLSIRGSILPYEVAALQRLRSPALTDRRARAGRTRPIPDKRSGNLFFTLQSGHVGRINTATGDIVIKDTPSDNTSRTASVSTERAVVNAAHGATT